MIFVTVGTQLRFPRLMDRISELANSMDEKIIAQTLERREFEGIESHFEMDEDHFETICSSARLMIGHAGIGTILSAQRFGRPLIVVPRRASLGEHRTDHQIATAKTLRSRSGVFVDWDGDNLPELISSTEKPMNRPSEKSHELVTTLKDFFSIEIQISA